jgi:hypothetical protein
MPQWQRARNANSLPAGAEKQTAPQKQDPETPPGGTIFFLGVDTIVASEFSAGALAGGGGEAMMD